MPHSIKIRGIAPADLASYPEPYRLQFWTFAARAALRVKDSELARGLDAHGDRLRPIAPITRRYRRSAMTPTGRGDPAAPPLMPARAKSRVRSLLAARAFATHAELYWRYDPFTGASFDVILNYQRAQGRDVFGVSAAGLAAIRKQALRDWADWLRGSRSITATGRALPAAALSRQQTRIAQVVAASAEPGAGAAARRMAGVGELGTRWITRGIEAPKIVDLRASATRTGGMTEADWRRFWTAAIPGSGSSGARTGPAPRPAPQIPRAAAMRPVRIEREGSLIRRILRRLGL